tara:strand:+ start:214 stop:1173 length:960 start_codon:yes stop_codon:yes gene_type:complete
MKLKDLFKQHEGDESQWISMSDMMTGLMIIFLLLFVVSVLSNNEMRDEKNKTVKNVHAWKKDYGLLQNKYNALKNDFDRQKLLTEKNISPEEYQYVKRMLEERTRDLSEERKAKSQLHAKTIAKRDSLIVELQNIWTYQEKNQYGIQVTKTGAINLTNGVFRPAGSWEVRPPLRKSLEKIMPGLTDYIKKNNQYIERVEIVGHASPDWPECSPNHPSNIRVMKYNGNEEKCKYFENMELSQKRSHSVLLEIDRILTGVLFGFDEFSLIKKVFFANGRSSSDKKHIGQIIDLESSRRVALYLKYNLDDIQKDIINAQNNL